MKILELDKIVVDTKHKNRGMTSRCFNKLLSVKDFSINDNLYSIKQYDNSCTDTMYSVRRVLSSRECIEENIPFSNCIKGYLETSLFTSKESSMSTNDYKTYIINLLSQKSRKYYGKKKS